jgi:hypothetical protein
MKRRMTAAAALALLGLGGCDKGSNSGATAAATASAAAAASATATAVATATPAAANGLTPLCKNPQAVGGNSLACYACVERECNAPFNAMVKGCGGYFACVATCDCNDKSCLMGCVSKMDSTCRAAAPPQGQCEKAHCASACMAHR